MKQYKYPSVLTIAGFDGSGGAGIQADIKTISALGCYATSVLTALPVQNTQGVRNIYTLPVAAVADQIEAIFDDIVPEAVKIGMVHTSELATTIVKTLSKYEKVPVIYDPVMVASSGHRLIEDETVQTIIEQLFPIADVITPNMDEAAVLAQMEVSTLDQMRRAGEGIAKLGCRSVLLKGGHQKTETITSLFIDENGAYHTFDAVKFDTANTHGSGCTLSSAIASYIALGEDLYTAVSLGQQYVYAAIEEGRDVLTGKGNGPLNHFFNPQKLIKRELV